MDDLDLLRYSRHILLDEIGIEGQEAIRQSHVLMIGAGGLGSACAPYLVAAGIGKITIIDHDTVELTNLQRQIIHTSESLGLHKVDSAKKMLNLLNPSCEVIAIPEKATEALLMQNINGVNIVIDCTDNFQTRHLINRFCVQYQIPLVSGAAIQFDGQVSVFTNTLESACYACIFPEEDGFEEVSCATMGVFAPLVGTIGAIQASQVLQMICHCGEPLTNKLLIWNAKNCSTTTIQLKKTKTCKVCGGS
jgi:molybdopterin-synthase adenylyltransferase